jgi:hypothetical protein
METTVPSGHGSSTLAPTAVHAEASVNAFARLRDSRKARDVGLTRFDSPLARKRYAHPKRYNGFFPSSAYSRPLASISISTAS